ncbi:CAP domain-containing protein [Zobellella maritima]|uniref:CAP domain-containing protein n=1 Tax=Zobellella maritima TaxID=2059725 RepID=UPI001E5D1F3D|nr:CAP domain-containing protein [Zobellella maritima]
MKKMMILTGLSLLLGCYGPGVESGRQSGYGDGLPASSVRTVTTAVMAGSLSEDERQGLLAYHNRVRAEVGTSPLRWSADASAQAERWARVLAKGCDIVHSQGSGFGENLFMGTLGYYDVLDGARSWQEEKRDYSGQPLTRSTAQVAGHYTQMVWHDTRELGCARSICRDNMILVCNYYPPGNYLGERAY